MMGKFQGLTDAELEVDDGSNMTPAMVFAEAVAMGVEDLSQGGDTVLEPLDYDWVAEAIRFDSRFERQVPEYQPQLTVREVWEALDPMPFDQVVWNFRQPWQTMVRGQGFQSVYAGIEVEQEEQGLDLELAFEGSAHGWSLEVYEPGGARGYGWEGQ